MVILYNFNNADNKTGCGIRWNPSKKCNVVNERQSKQFALTEALLIGPVHVK